MELLPPQSPRRNVLVQLVQKCLNEHGENEGFIERRQFLSFCADLSVSVDELDSVFNELDGDQDGRINVSDFTSGFDQVSCLFDKVELETRHVVNGSTDKSFYECQVDSIGSPMQIIAGQQYISELYYNLTNSNQPDLLDLFEKHLASVVKDIKARAAETQRLEEALKRATKQHARQVNNLDHEVEQQMEKLETKVRQEEKSLSKKKLSDLHWQLENKDKEIASMGKTIETLQNTLQKEITRPPLKDEMESLSQENRIYRSQVTDSQTAIAVLRSELAQLRSDFVEQSEQFHKEKIIANDALQEQENLARQLQLLHDANQKLHDVNDELRGALETKKCFSSPQRTTPDVLRLSGVFSEPGRDLSASMRSNGRCHSATPSLRRPTPHGNRGDDNSFNQSSLFAELNHASTPCKDFDEEDEAYGTMSKPNKGHVEKQIQILEDTNKRLSSSNDELRVALKLMTRSGSFRKSKKSSSGTRRTASFHSDYGSLSSRSSRSFSPKVKRCSPAPDAGEGTDESTTYDNEVEDDDHVETIAEETFEDMAQGTRDFKGDEKLGMSDDELIIANATATNGNSYLSDSDISPELELLMANIDDGDDNIDDGDNIDDDGNNHDDDDENECCLNSSTMPSKRTHHESLECINEKAPNGKTMYTRSRSLELFYHKSLANLRTPAAEDGKESTINRKGDSPAFNSSLEENNNDNRVGLWDITKKLNAHERIKSQASMEELNRYDKEEDDVLFEPPKKKYLSSRSESESETTSELSEVSDSTTMNSETIADLEAQFLKINESHDHDEEMSKDKNEKKNDVEDDEADDDDDDDDDDDVNSVELAELVALASETSDDSESDSEPERNRSGNHRVNSHTEAVSTMTTDSLSLSLGTPERMYKLVLAGDAAVGKSSFILRLCKNKFHANLNATLGVDFQVKNVNVDSKTVALQLWDTAGQERFRSIAKSYFRKVDGVLLLYDVTCEASFVNVRDWMQTIEESAQKNVPVMLCANKCDLRDEMKQEGKKVITTESGQRLASHYNALFIETSAKDGKNIEDACKELARILGSIENKEIEQSGLKLDKSDNKDKKKRTCCPS